MPRNKSKSLNPKTKSEQKHKGGSDVKKPLQRSKSMKETIDEDNKNKPKRQYTKFNPRLFELHSHFKSFFGTVKENDKRFVCNACKEKNQNDYEGYYDNIARHLETETHLESVGEDLKEEIEAAIESFKSFRKKKKVIHQINKKLLTV